MKQNIMNQYYWSALTASFYPVGMYDRYAEAGSWPDDAVPVSQAVFEKYSQPPPEGYTRAAGKNGMPVWVKLPEPDPVPIFQNAIQMARRNAENFLPRKYLIFNKPVPAEWITYLKKLEAFASDTSVRAGKIPPLPEPPEPIQ